MVFKENYLDPDQIKDSIRLIKRMAADQGLDVVLIGGVALQIYGSPKFTKYVDFAISSLPEEVGPLRKMSKISFGGERYSAPNGAKIDLVVRNDEYTKLYQEAMENAIDSPAGIPIVTPEYLAVMKLAAGREHDILALKWMVRQQDLLDVKKARKIAYKMLGRFGQDRFDDAVDQAMIELEMQKKRGRHPEEE